jgi:hypothetical protein
MLFLPMIQGIARDFLQLLLVFASFNGQRAHARGAGKVSGHAISHWH